MAVDINRIKQRIKALLARNEKNGASIAEAQTCLEKAQSLLDEFNIDIQELLEDTDPNTQKVIREEIYESGNISPELWELQTQVAWLFNCEAIRSRKYQKGCKYRRVHISIIGNPINVEKVKYFLNLFNDTIQQSLKIENITGLRNINSFKRGFYLALANKAAELRWEREDKEKENQKNCTGTSLLVLDRQNVDEFIKQEIPLLKTKTNNFSNFGKATELSNYNKGKNYGNNMNFNEPLNHNKGVLTCKN